MKIRITLRGILIFFLVLAGPVHAQPEQQTLVRIGTGGTGGNYYPVGKMLADIIGDPTGRQKCYSGEICGIPGLLAVAQTSNGSVANINGIVRGDIESGFVQSDIFFLASEGLEMFNTEPASKKIKALASLYSEQLHLVARRDAGITSLMDLKGKRVSLDIPGSGTLVDARIVLHAHGLREEDLKAEYNKSNIAIDKMLRGDLDAFFIVAGYPVKALVELSNKLEINLVAIEPKEAERIVSRYPFLSVQSIPADVYHNVAKASTVGVSALWVVKENMDHQLAYNMTKAFWNEMGRGDYSAKHPLSSQITLATALEGIKGRLHSGALQFYREAGLAGSLK